MPSDDSLNDAMANAAAQAVEMAARGRLHLDFSLESLLTVEAQLDSLHKALPRGWFAKLAKPGPSDEEIDAMALSIGAYVGEVLRRHLGGEWRSANSMQPDVRIPTLHLSNGSEVWPQVKVNKRLRLGAEESVWIYAQSLMRELGR
jgi:hypothetical protein